MKNERIIESFNDMQNKFSVLRGRTSLLADLVTLTTPIVILFIQMGLLGLIYISFACVILTSAKIVYSCYLEVDSKESISKMAKQLTKPLLLSSIILFGVYNASLFKFQYFSPLIYSAKGTESLISLDTVFLAPEDSEESIANQGKVTEEPILSKATGIVIDSKTKEPLVNARITYLGETAYSNDFGKFELPLDKESDGTLNEVEVIVEGYQYYIDDESFEQHTTVFQLSKTK